ncbi:MAG TPA: hypothetical protein VHA80_05605 [Solirubrobacterales bacterium]|nr:hypothetical protein [Solirubrobacterales bacterium]
MPDAYRLEPHPGGDATLIREADRRRLRVGVREATWALDVRSRWLRRGRTPAVRTAAENLDGEVLRRIAEEITDRFWSAADWMAVAAGFTAGCRAGGRSGGWALVGDARDPGARPPWAVDPGERRRAGGWLGLAFGIDELRRAAEEEFDHALLAANRELQVELSCHVDWIGAEVRTPDGSVERVERVLVREGRACLDFFDGFAFAAEASLVRRADGEVPARSGADPIMEEVFRIIEARGEVSRRRLDDWLDAAEEHDPTCLYEAHVAPAVDAIEDAIVASGLGDTR